MASLLDVGDTLSGIRIEEKLRDEDGSVVFVLSDGSYVEVPPWSNDPTPEH